MYSPQVWTEAPGHTYRANTAVPPPIDPTSNVYEYVVQTDCLVGPFVALNGIPWIKDIPGLGVPAELKWSAARVANALGVAGVGGTVASITGSSPAQVGPGNSSSTTVSVNGPGWNNPNLFEEIQAAGQTVVASDVLIVPGNAINTPGAPPAFTTTSFSVDPSEKVWMDTQAVGQWGIQGWSGSQVNASGSSNLGSWCHGIDLWVNGPNSLSGLSWPITPGREIGNNYVGFSGLVGYMGSGINGSPPPAGTCNPEAAWRVCVWSFAVFLLLCESKQ